MNRARESVLEFGIMIILASNSPRRKQILASGGWVFKVIPAEIDEHNLPGETPAAYVLRLAREKAWAVAARTSLDAVIVAADTTVVDGNDILGKPADSIEAERMLRRLRGRAHQVLTAVAVWHAGNLESDLCATEVRMRAYPDDEMQAYIASGDPFDKAGAYAIQHSGFKPVENLHGCFSNVVGLPLCLLARLVEALQIELPADLPGDCRDGSSGPCTIYRRLMSEISDEKIENYP